MSSKPSFKELQDKYVKAFREGEGPFRDWEFEPDMERSIISRKTYDSEYMQVLIMRWRLDMKSLHTRKCLRWMRAYEYAKDAGNGSPRLVVDGVSQLDINQGNLGDCWFLVGLAHLADRPDLFRQVVPLDQNFERDYGGLFHFYFWVYGEWKEVIIDDWLPITFDEGRKEWIPLCVRNYMQKNEFWAPLVEKAYAKLNNNYEEIKGGFGRWSMVDLTGGLGFTFVLGYNHQNAQAFFSTVHSLKKYDTLFACGNVPEELAEKHGLETGHAYTLIDMATVYEKDGNSEHYLVKVINPHGLGHSEWTGDWSDGDKANWSSLRAEDQKLRSTAREGEFWMTYEDFVKYFEQIDVCLVPPVNPGAATYSRKDKKPGWAIYTSPRSLWVPGRSAAFWKCPQFRFQVPLEGHTGASLETLRESTVFFSLSRITRESNPMAYVSMNFNVYFVRDDNVQRITQKDVEKQRVVSLQTVRASNNAYRAAGVRDLMASVNLKPGYYCVIPWFENPPAKEEFILRVANAPDVCIDL